MSKLLYLNLSEASDDVLILESIPSKLITLKRVALNWDSIGDSTANGSEINVEIVGALNHNHLNSNRTRNISTIPLYNDNLAISTFYDSDLSFRTSSDIRKEFKVHITRADGSAVTNLASVQLWMQY